MSLGLKRLRVVLLAELVNPLVCLHVSAVVSTLQFRKCYIAIVCREVHGFY